MPLSAQTPQQQQAQPAKRPLELADMFRFKRVSDPQISPDGRFIAFVVGEVNKAENKVNSDIWLVTVTGGVVTNPASARKIVASPKADNHPRWSPDGKTLSFVSTRTGAPQVFVLALADALADLDKPSGKERQLTTLNTGATAQYFSPDGTMLAFVSSVFPEFSEKPFAESNRLNKEKSDARDASPMKAVVIERLLYRHWDSWTDGTRQHIFVQPLAQSTSGIITAGEPRDITPGDRDAIPNADTFSAGDDYAWSPDGKEIAYTASPLPQREEAWSTNYDVFTVNVQTGERKQVSTTAGADAYPRYSPDGKWLAFRSQSVQGFEADRWQLSLVNRATGELSSPTKQWDYSVQQFEWMPDSKRLVFEAEENAETPLWMLPVEQTTLAKGDGKDIKKIVTAGANSALSVAKDSTICFAQSLLTQPAEVFTVRLENIPKPANLVRRATAVNEALLNEIDFGQVEKFYFLGARVKNQAWIVRPPASKFPTADPAKKYPVVFLIHGGPQGAWGNAWSNRWNAQLWAAQGYVVVAPNPTGSTGFGQEFVNGVSKDWGGKPYVDVMKCVDHVVGSYPFVDKDRMAAAGASYGGYMVNWIATQSNRFKTLVTHCGVYNFASMYATTDEVWFDEWEHGKPWEKGFEEMEKQSPHKFVQNIKTPMLVIHDGNDFRVPLQEGMQLFNSLQRRGIPSKFLYIPDEGHWVLKPQNSEFWHTAIFNWLGEYLKK